MTTYEIIIRLCEENDIAPTALEKKLGFGRGSIGKLKSGSTSAARLQKIANYFNVSLAYLMSGKEEPDTNILKNSHDVGKDIDRLITQMKSKDSGTLMYNGVELLDVEVDLFQKDLVAALDRLREYNRLINSQKNEENNDN